MYIFNRYDAHLSTPLNVLYKFLEFYSTFDWENYGISINGPFCLNALPAVELLELPQLYQPIFTSAFLKECQEQYGVVLHDQPFNFMPKFLNIIDPLREFNNLGTSVSKTNFLRIRRAFARGYKTLQDICTGNLDSSCLLHIFFRCSWRQFGHDLAPVGSLLPASPISSPTKPPLATNFVEYKKNLLYAKRLLKQFPMGGIAFEQKDGVSSTTAPVFLSAGTSTAQPVVTPIPAVISMAPTISSIAPTVVSMAPTVVSMAPTIASMVPASPHPIPISFSPFQQITIPTTTKRNVREYAGNSSGNRNTRLRRKSEVRKSREGFTQQQQRQHPEQPSYHPQQNHHQHEISSPLPNRSDTRTTRKPYRSERRPSGNGESFGQGNNTKVPPRIKQTSLFELIQATVTKSPPNGKLGKQQQLFLDHLTKA